MSTFKMELVGLEALKALVRSIPDVVRTHMGDVIETTSFAVASRARATVRVETGAYKAAITSTAKGLSGRVGVAAGVFNGRRPEIYWRFVEFGTVKTPAHPTFRAATESETPGFEARIRGIVGKIERDLSISRAA